MSAMTVVTMRPYIPKDYPGVMEVLKDGGLYDQEMDSEMRFNNKVAKSAESILVAHDGEKVIGCIIIIDDWGPLLFRLAIAKDYQKRGLGSQLLDAAESYLRKKYFREAHLLVDEREKELVKFYEKRGYQQSNLYRWMWKKL
jgi:ribosomal protein S18 acetylase RimI-like enzyme